MHYDNGFSMKKAWLIIDSKITHTYKKYNHPAQILFLIVIWLNCLYHLIIIRLLLTINFH